MPYAFLRFSARPARPTSISIAEVGFWVSFFQDLPMAKLAAADAS